MTYTTLADLFKGICDAIRTVIGNIGSIRHQEIPEKINAVAVEVDAQNALIEEISMILEDKVSSYPVVEYNESTKTLTITEVSS